MCIRDRLKDGYLTVSGAKGLDQDEQEKETGRYIRRERYAGAVSYTHLRLMCIDLYRHCRAATIWN